MVGTVMTLALRDAVNAALPDEQRLQRALAELSPAEWDDLAAVVASQLPEVDVVIAFPDEHPLAWGLGQLRGLPVLGADLQPGKGSARGPLSGEGVLVSEQLGDGLAEIEIIMRAEAHGLNVPLVVTPIERTNMGGRSRLELQTVQVKAVIQLADTPNGLVAERRTPASRR